MKHYYILFFWLCSLSAVQAQRVFPVAEQPTFATLDTAAQISYVELREPYLPNDPQRVATVLIHVLDPEKRPYSGYLFRLEYKDFTSGTWRTYQDYETTVVENNGFQRIMPLIHQLPNGYYRVWAQCLKTKRVGTEPLLLNVSSELPEPIQFTLTIPQSQTWKD